MLLNNLGSSAGFLSLDLLLTNDLEYFGFNKKQAIDVNLFQNFYLETTDY